MEHYLNMIDHARRINTAIDENFPIENREIRQVLCLAEEVGEFVGAWRRYSGNARRTGTWEAMVTELADVIVTAYVMAEIVTANTENITIHDIIKSKLEVIYSRGWREWTGAGFGIPSTDILSHFSSPEPMIHRYVRDAEGQVWVWNLSTTEPQYRLVDVAGANWVKLSELSYYNGGQLTPTDKP